MKLFQYTGDENDRIVFMHENRKKEHKTVYQSHWTKLSPSKIWWLHQSLPRYDWFCIYWYIGMPLQSENIPRRRQMKVIRAVKCKTLNRVTPMDSYTVVILYRSPCPWISPCIYRSPWLNSGAGFGNNGQNQNQTQGGGVSKEFGLHFTRQQESKHHCISW